MARDIFSGIGRSGKARAFDWQTLHNSAALEVLVEILAAGAYVGLGTTSDGGAVGITILVGDSRAKEYWVDLDSDEVVAWLREVLERIQEPASSTPTRIRRPPATKGEAKPS